ncbi:hypothetical protein AVEN_140506-1 [Araneus ventricosus]|uniref:Uncharacterized protein n=1 Tax=Araneus ventricosus TaxID=182803 RepID=A0A4Y2RJQ4_ARAVE|nr:hypothetical protein AVEN_140506-1 [Araneus ventricosus]
MPTPEKRAPAYLYGSFSPKHSGCSPSRGCRSRQPKKSYAPSWFGIWDGLNDSHQHINTGTEDRVLTAIKGLETTSPAGRTVIGVEVPAKKKSAEKNFF